MDYDYYRQQLGPFNTEVQKERLLSPGDKKEIYDIYMTNSLPTSATYQRILDTIDVIKQKYRQDGYGEAAFATCYVTGEALHTFCTLQLTGEMLR